ncbi:MAG: apolipoprotein N-acyltransferase [Proteobacteria bacterium]|nr:apolipoprotein N-acyltransferase [Pseudomonadota bacterium]
MPIVIVVAVVLFAAFYLVVPAAPFGALVLVGTIAYAVGHIARAMTQQDRQGAWKSLDQRLDIRVVATIGSAASTALLAAPMALYWLAYVAYVPMFWALRQDTPRANRWLALLWGTTSVAIIFRWLVDTITLYSNIPWIVAVALTVLFAVVFGLPYLLFWPATHFIRRHFGSWWVILLPCWLVLIEYVAMRVLLFPYNQGISQHRFLFTFQLASLTGVYGLSFLVFLVNSALAEVIYRRREGREFPTLQLCGAFSTLSVVIIFGAWRFERVEAALDEAPTIRVAQLQQSITMVERLQQDRKEVFMGWLDATQKIPANSVDLVVWPEGASPYYLNAGRAPDHIGALAKRGNYPIIVGGGTRLRVKDATGKTVTELYNSVYSFDRHGEVEDHYDKMMPLPFGEYFPMADWVPWLAEMIEGVGRFKAGVEPKLLGDDGLRLATPICYEAIMAHLCRRFNSPDLLVNVTNDGWFGDTSAPHLHAMLAIARATELGTPMFRSAYTGISLVVEPHGHIYAKTKPFTDVNRVVTVRVRTFPTLYYKYGDWFVALCLAALVLARLLLPWRRQE